MHAFFGDFLIVGLLKKDSYVRVRKPKMAWLLFSGRGSSVAPSAPDQNETPCSRSAILLRCGHPIGDVEGARAETYRRVRAGQPVRRQEVARQYGVSEVTVRAAAREALAVVADEDEATQPTVHVHDWGPWTRFHRCDECGEHQTETGDEPADAHS
jgi:hypothetical protein